MPEREPLTPGRELEPGEHPELEALEDLVERSAPRLEQLASELLGLEAAAHAGDLPREEVVEALGRAVDALDRHLGHVRFLSGELSAALAGVMPAKWWMLASGLPIERVSGTKRTEWRRDELTQALTRAALRRSGAVSEDGEASPALVEAVETTVAIITSAARLEARMGNEKTGEGLRGLGIDPADYCTETPGRPGVRLHRPEKLAPGAGTNPEEDLTNG